tara:strand:- start:2359 stop:2808 length:450 start_codon:yes stop_codon:yes gene_type:complete
MINKNLNFNRLVSSIRSCFPIIPASDSKTYVKPFRQYKDLSDKVVLELTDFESDNVTYWTTIPAMFLCYLSDMLGFKDECLDYLAMGVTKHEGHSEYQRYVDHFDLIRNQIVFKSDWELNEGEKAFLRKLKIVRTKINQIEGSDSMFQY